ncbi:MAG: hypothetical protein IPF45_03510 [Thermomonas sp.]|nr:hypothetical protein [Thermomonas sp.]
MIEDGGERNHLGAVAGAAIYSGRFAGRKTKTGPDAQKEPSRLQARWRRRDGRKQPDRSAAMTDFRRR